MSEKDLLITLGIGLGATMDQLLDLTANDITDGYISLPVGPLQIKRTYLLPEEVKRALQDKNGKLFTMSRDDAVSITETDNFLPFTMKRYYAETSDIYYPMHLMGIEREEDCRKLLSSISLPFPVPSAVDTPS